MIQRNLIAAFEALSDSGRLDVYRVLMLAAPAGLSAGRIAEYLQITAPALSVRLTRLRHAKLISCRRDGRFLIYSANLFTAGGMARVFVEGQGRMPDGDASSSHSARRPGKSAAAWS